MHHETEPVAGIELLLALERDRGASLHEQLELSLRESVRSGRLPPGSRLPSSRALAREIGVSRGVVLEAYAQLTAEGYLTATQGAPTRVARAPSTERPAQPATSLEPGFAYQFDPGLPDVAGFPRDGWLRSLRAVARKAPFSAFGHGDPRGAPALRNELMAYLGRVRGAAAEPEHTLVCAGFTQGFAALCRVLRDRGIDRIAMEDPGWVQHRLVAERAGLEPVGVAVDAQGIDVDALAATGCETVVVTPAHQFPAGVVLSPERRAALIAWAEDEDALIVEDDYDAELRLHRGPVGALQGLAPERVCHIGSASKRLAPGVRVGWVLSPSWLTGDLTYEKALDDGGSPILDQLALADFIARGELGRHLRRMRLRYRARRQAMAAVLARLLPEARIAGARAGLFAPVLLPSGVDEAAVLSAAAALGVGVEGLGRHRFEDGGDAPPGFALGYANLSERAIEQGIARLARALRSVSA